VTAREARARRVDGRARRTFLPLEPQLRKPSDYQVTSSALLYYPERGFEVETPVWQHYQEHQRGSIWSCRNWEAFEDPAHTTYRSYVAARRDQEAFLDRFFERPSPPLASGLRPLLGVLSALRFPLHGLQMTAAYVGALAPSGRICVAAAFQAADELRRIQRLCQWLSRSGVSVSELDALGREQWQEQPAFQPLRRLIEELLVTYDWGQALITLNGVVKPIFDRLWFEHLALAVAPHDDEVLLQTLRSLAEDGRWHEAWFAELAKLVFESDSRNVTAFTSVSVDAHERASHALSALLPAFAGVLGDDTACRGLAERLSATLAARWEVVGAV
jgi:toluene monooxygenase system protein E